jgi:hypothetical protein
MANIVVLPEEAVFERMLSWKSVAAFAKAHVTFLGNIQGSASTIYLSRLI